MTQPDNTAPLKFSGTLDIYAAEAFREALAQSLEHCPALRLDLSGVDACDIVALQLLCSARRSAEAAGKTFELTAVSEVIIQTRNLVGLAPSELPMPEYA